MLSTSAFNALLKILEEPPAHLMFILATTELHKVPATIKSRCQQFSFQRILPADIARRLSYVAEREGIDLKPEGAALLARLADGGLRDALSLLDQCAVSGGPVGEQRVLDALGLAGGLETGRLMGRVADHDAAGALEDIARLYGGGKDVSAILGELSSLARDLLIRKTAPTAGGALLTGGFDDATLRGPVQRFTPAKLAWVLSTLQSTLADLPRSSNRRTDARAVPDRLCDETLDDSVPAIHARLARVEAQLAFGVPIQTTGEMPLQEKREVRPNESLKTEGQQGKILANLDAPATETPPWEESSTAQGPASQEAVRPVRTAEPVSAPASVPSGDFWPALAESLRDQVGRNVWSFLGNAAMTRGPLEDGVLTLWADDDLVKGVIGRQAVLDTVARAASARVGSPVRVTVKVGKPESAPAAPAPAHDNLDDLLAFSQQFDNITIK
jgi:DNA polymerase-3 subunit gamma/tau